MEKWPAKFIRLIVLMSVFWLFLTVQLLAVNEVKKMQADSLYQEGMKLIAANEYDSALLMFQQAVKKNRKLADAYHEIAKIYMERNTVYDRLTASRQLDKALRLDWHNPDYRFTKALLLIKMGMSGSAMNEFKKVLKVQPDRYMAYYQMGLLLERDCLHYRDLVDPEETGTIYFRKFSEEDKQDVVYYYNKVIATNPRFTEVYYRLGLIYYEFGDLDEMIHLLEKAVKINPGDKNCHLFLGFAYHQSERYQEARHQYNEAMALMPEDELSIFTSIDMLLTPEEKEQYEKASERKRARMKRQFWQQRDPFFLTPGNERLLEHFSRVAYANLRFYIPLKEVEGWRTDQGKVYIRFGKPTSMYRTKAELASIGAAGSALITSKEVWQYPDFNMMFEDRSMLRRYVFAWGDQPENDYRSVYEQLIKETPEQYNYLQDEDRLPVIADPVCFRDTNDRTVMNVNSALPGDSLHFLLTGDKWLSKLKTGVFVHDTLWQLVACDSATISVPETSLQTIGRNRYFINASELSVLAGAHQLSVEFWDTASGKRGVYRSLIHVDTFSVAGLQMSELLMAMHITPDSSQISWQRSNLEITPNPVRKIVPDMPIYLYYEIYNLTHDQNGMTRYRVEYRFGADRKRDNVFRKIFTSLKLLKPRGSVRTSYEYEGNSDDEYLYQILQIPNHINGHLEMEVLVRDLIAKTEKSRTLKFDMEIEE